jgi:uncharacterized protein
MLSARGAWSTLPGRLVFAGLSVLAGVAILLSLGGEGRVRFGGVPLLQFPLPGAPAEGPSSPPEAGHQSTSTAEIASPALPGLLEDGPFGPLPRIGPDGRRPFLAYAGPFDLDDQRPRIALLVVGLGLQADLTEAAIALPGEISLHFSAYAADLPGWFERARRAGHEVLLDLPMEPLDYPASDPGPHTLLASNSTEENLKRLDWLLARATGYVAVAGGGARFAASERTSAVLDVLARRGLALIELNQPKLATAANAVGLPYASAASAIDADPSALAIDAALAGLGRQAVQHGSALAFVQAYPISLERLRRWSASLEGKGLVLAPVSAVVIQQAGLAANSRSEVERRGRAQG